MTRMSRIGSERRQVALRNEPGFEGGTASGRSELPEVVHKNDQC